MQQSSRIFCLAKLNLAHETLIPLSFPDCGSHLSSLRFYDFYYFIFRMSEIIEHLFFCDGFISLSIMSLMFIHVLACNRIFSLFKGCIIIPLHVYAIFSLSVHLLIDIWVVSTS